MKYERYDRKSQITLPLRQRLGWEIKPRFLLRLTLSFAGVCVCVCVTVGVHITTQLCQRITSVQIPLLLETFVLDERAMA